MTIIKTPSILISPRIFLSIRGFFFSALFVYMYNIVKFKSPRAFDKIPELELLHIHDRSAGLLSHYNFQDRKLNLLRFLSCLVRYLQLQRIAIRYDCMKGNTDRANV